MRARGGYIARRNERKYAQHPEKSIVLP